MKRIVLLLIGLLITADVYSAVYSSVDYVITLDNHSAPSDVIFLSENIVSVYDANSGALRYYTNGRFTREQRDEKLKNGTCFKKYDNSYIFCNNKNNEINILGQNLSILKTLTPSDKLRERFDPTDVEKIGNNLYAVDNDNHRIVTFSYTQGKMFSSVGGYGEDRLKFWYPYSIVFDGVSKTFFVSEVLNTRVQKLTMDLKFYDFLGSWGVTGGTFYRPTGVAIVGNKYIAVGDGYLGVVQFFDRNLKFQDVLKGKDQKRLNLGSVVRLRAYKNKLAVIDGWNKKVYIITIGDRP